MFLTCSIYEISKPASSNSHCKRILSAILVIRLKSVFKKTSALNSNPETEALFPELSIPTKNLNRTDSP